MKASNLPKRLNQCSAFTITRRPQKWTKRKSCIMWMRYKTVQWPIAYISKPKHVPQQLFNEFMDSIQVQLLMFPEGNKTEQLETTTPAK